MSKSGGFSGFISFLTGVQVEDAENELLTEEEESVQADTAEAIKQSAVEESNTAVSEPIVEDSHPAYQKTTLNMESHREMPRMRLNREKPETPKRTWGMGSINKWQSSGRTDREANNSKKVVNLQAQVKMDLTIESPEDFSEARELCGRMQKKQPLVVDFECMDLEKAQRLTDFLCGACYALGGTVKQISDKVFLLMPDNMDINPDAEFLRTLESEGGLSMD